MNKKLTKSKVFSRFIMYLFLLIITILSIFPFYWMFIVGSNTNAVINCLPPKLVPGKMFLTNFNRTWELIPIFHCILNSAILSVTITFFVLILSSMAGAAFAKLDFPHKSFLFGFVLFTMMIPMQLGVIPRYIIISKLHLVNKLSGVVIPSLVNAFGVFWMRQFIMETVPDDMINAAKIDGCNYLKIYTSIILPVIKSGLATLGIITFMNVWNDYFWPSIVLHTNDKITIQLALKSLNNAMDQDYSMVLSATFVSTLPLLIIFLIFNKQFIAGVTEGSIK